MTTEVKNNEVSQAIEKIEQAKHDPELRITRRIEIGSVIQQGDIYLHRVEDSHLRGELLGEQSVQLAAGTSNGARHIATGSVKVFRGTTLPPNVQPPMGADPSEVTGPLVVADETWNLMHPEHPHHRLPAGCYQVTYQYDPQTMRRVQD